MSTKDQFGCCMFALVLMVVSILVESFLVMLGWNAVVVNHFHWDDTELTFGIAVLITVLFNLVVGSLRPSVSVKK